MPKFSYSVRYRDKVGKAAINALGKIYGDVAFGIMNELPTTFPKQLTNRVRRYFTDNYSNQEGWNDPSLTPQYAFLKNKMLKRGDSFDIGTIGVFPIIHGAEIFGRRTDCIFDALQGRDGSTVERIGPSVNGNQVNMSVKMGLNLDSFAGGTKRISGKSGKVVSNTDKNALEMFSNRIGSGTDTSPLIKITSSQRSVLGAWIKEEIKSAMKRFMDAARR